MSEPEASATDRQTVADASGSEVAKDPAIDFDAPANWLGAQTSPDAITRPGFEEFTANVA